MWFGGKKDDEFQLFKRVKRKVALNVKYQFRQRNAQRKRGEEYTQIKKTTKKQNKRRHSGLA